MTYDIDDASADGAQESPPTWIAPQPDPFSAGELLRKAGIRRVGSYDFERAAPGSLFHEGCGYLWKLHDNRDSASVLPFGCPSENEARAAFGDR